MAVLKLDTRAELIETLEAVTVLADHATEHNSGWVRLKSEAVSELCNVAALALKGQWEPGEGMAATKEQV